MRGSCTISIALGWMSFPLIFMAVCSHAAEKRDFPVFAAAKWRAETIDGDRVVFRDEADTLVMEYNLNVTKIHQVGHQPFKEAEALVLLAEPIALNPQEKRIVFEAKGIDLSRQTRGKRAVLLFPLIRDEKGEIFSYLPYPGSHFLAGSTGWSTWKSQCFYASEGGAATHDIFDARGGDGNCWPDGKLAFLGFALRVRTDAFGPVSGTLCLGGFSTAGLRLPEENPFLYADALFRQSKGKEPLKSGSYRLAVEIRDEFQALPVKEYAGILQYDLTDPAVKKRKISFPLDSDGSYWLRYRLSDPEGETVCDEDLRYEVEGMAQAVSRPRVSGTNPPVIGQMRFNPDKHANGVYDRDEPMKVVLRIFPKDANPLRLRWTVRSYLTADEIAAGERDLDFADRSSLDHAVEFSLPPGEDACRLEAQLLSAAGKTAVDRGEYILGRRSDLEHAYPGCPGTAPDRDEIKGSSLIQLTYAPPAQVHFARAPYERRKALLDDYQAFALNAKHVSRNLNYRVNLPDFEVLPGVYDFSVLDQIMDISARNNCFLTLRPWINDRTAPLLGTVSFRWLPYERQRSYDGSPILSNTWSGGFSPCSSALRKMWRDSFSALYARYRNHRAFLGYFQYQPMGEVPWQEMPYAGILTGYEKAAAMTFAKYLRENKKYTLDDLNRRWKTKFAGWSDVCPPLPDFEKGKTPDLRPQWIDFMDFKQWQFSEWHVMLATHIRSFDSKRVIIAHLGDFKLLRGLVDYIGNGGNHEYQRSGEYVEAWEKGRLGQLSEPHHPYGWAAADLDPKQEGWGLDTETFAMIAQGDGGSANLHVYWSQNGCQNLKTADPYGLMNHFGSWYGFDRMEKFKSILQELYYIRINRHPVAAVMHDPYTVYCKHRTIFSARMEDLERWNELLKHDGVEFAEFGNDSVRDCRLILPNLLDEVMSRENIRKLAEAVRAGANTIVSARTGMYAPDSGESPFQLLKEFGIRPPESGWQTMQEHVNAIASESPFFAEGQCIPFYSLADYSRDLHSPEINRPEYFWQWAYRWLPQTDYLGYYPGLQVKDGKVWAKFADGGAAVSIHGFGKGHVMVFWGTPDYRPEKMKGFMRKAVLWSGGKVLERGNPVAMMLEGESERYGRRYALLYQGDPGTFRQRLYEVPDGQWLIDDMVSDQRLGTWTGEELRKTGIELTFASGMSPLKILRLLPVKSLSNPPEWQSKYRMPEK